MIIFFFKKGYEQHEKPVPNFKSPRRPKGPVWGTKWSGQEVVDTVMQYRCMMQKKDVTIVLEF